MCVRGLGGSVSERWTAVRVAKAVQAKRVHPARDCKRAWKGFCPSHRDKKASLGVSEKPDGQILLKCFAGCALEQILEALGMRKQDLFPVRARHREIAFQYNYYDEKYCLLYRLVRLKPKAFYFERPDGRGGWIRNAEGVRKVLYRLPEVLAAQRVAIVEGEKDCRTIRKLEKFLAFPYTATTSGSADSWKTEYSEWLRGKDVVIVPDKGKAGARFRREVVRSLRDKASSLKVVKLPVGKDVTAWMEAGESQDWEGAAEQLLGFIAQAPELRRRRSGDYEAAIVAFIDQRAKTVKEIRDQVIGKTCDLDKALRSLHAKGEVQRTGDGVRNSPFRYSLSDSSLSLSSFPPYTHSLRNVLPRSKGNIEEPRMNSEPIPVPNFSKAEFLKMESANKECAKAASTLASFLFPVLKEKRMRRGNKKFLPRRTVSK